ncbi:Hypothetical protein I5071_5520 [Sandaracinus amylolyticus]|nr:Hypothetical protein I5071_5520 [Sandaracinus amylolyticus]
MIGGLETPERGDVGARRGVVDVGSDLATGFSSGFTAF